MREVSWSLAALCLSQMQSLLFFKARCFGGSLSGTEALGQEPNVKLNSSLLEETSKAEIFFLFLNYLPCLFRVSVPPTSLNVAFL